MKRREGNLKDFPEYKLASKHIENIRKIIFETILVSSKKTTSTNEEESKKLVEEIIPKFLIEPYVIEFCHIINGLLREITLTCQSQGNLFVDNLKKTNPREFHRYVCALHLICGLHDIYSDVSKKLSVCVKTENLLEYETLNLVLRLFCTRTQDAIISILTNQLLGSNEEEDGLKGNVH